jgi:hypothetical protein
MNISQDADCTEEWRHFSSLMAPGTGDAKSCREAPERGPSLMFVKTKVCERSEKMFQAQIFCFLEHFFRELV